MDQIEIENLIDIISYGSIEILYKSNLFTLHQPTRQDRYRSTQIYNKEFNAAILIGLKRDNELLQNHIDAGVWTIEQEQDIEKLKKQIHGVKKGLLDFIFQKEKIITIKRHLRKLESDLITTLNDRQELLTGSADNHALMCKQRYIISRSTYKENGQKMWKTYIDFEDDSNMDFINILTTSFFQTSRIGTIRIREISRSHSWRSTWSVAKSISGLFDTPISRWSANQNDLIYWSQLYDMVNESYDRPKQEIIEDDDLLDSWLIRQGEKSQGNDSSGSNHGESKHKFKNKGRQEQFVMSDKGGAPEVYSMNSSGDRQKIITKQSIISKHGSVKEQEMPDSKMEMRLIATGQRKAKIDSVRKR